MVYAGRIKWKNFPKKSVRHMALRPRPMRQSLHLCKEQVIKAAMDLGEPKRRYLHVAVNLLRFTVSSEQPAQNSHPPHPGYLLGHSSIGSTLLLTYTHMPALPASQGVFPALSLGMDSHRLPDDQPIFDQLPDLLAWEITIYLVSQVGPNPTRQNSRVQTGHDRGTAHIPGFQKWCKQGDLLFLS